MHYRKFAADQMFTGKEMLDDKAVLITDARGKIIEIVSVAEAGEGLERFNGILCPGFINCHCHLELSHLRGTIPRGSGMVPFLLTVMNNRNFPQSVIQEAMKVAETYMRERGIAAVGDICNTDHSIGLKNSSDIHYHNFIEVAGFAENTAETRFSEANDLFQKFVATVGQSGKNLKASIVPHAPYSVSEKLFGLITNNQQNALLTVHNQESEAETEMFRTGKGEFLDLYKSIGADMKKVKANKYSSLVATMKMISSGHSLILVHNVHTSEEDLEWIKSVNSIPELFWCLCPNANIYINNKVPDVSLLQKYNCKIVIGTDSLASNLQLNVLEELKTLQENFPHLSTAVLLQLATVNGAEALRIQNLYGSFEKGKTPGIVSIDGGRNNLLTGTVAKRIL